jgi:homoserine kinase
VTRFAVSVPATSANLGPGFDAIGLALDLRMRAEVEVLPAGSAARWRFSGSEAPSHDGLQNEIARAIATIAPGSPPLAVTVENAVPLGRGMGASAAGAALGLAIGAALRDPPPDERELARTVTVIEGHPDNGIPAVVGGVVVAAAEGDDVVYTRFDPPPDVRAVVVVPEIEMPTRQARAILPNQYAKADAVYNVGRAALLAAAFASGRIELLAAAMRDRLHQPYRATFVPGLEAMLALDDASALGIALSGAGPSVIALARPGSRIGERIAAIFREHAVSSRTFDLALARAGIVREG